MLVTSVAVVDDDEAAEVVVGERLGLRSEMSAGERPEHERKCGHPPM